MATRTGPDYKVTFVPDSTPLAWKDHEAKVLLKLKHLGTGATRLRDRI